MLREENRGVWELLKESVEEDPRDTGTTTSTSTAGPSTTSSPAPAPTGRYVPETGLYGFGIKKITDPTTGSTRWGHTGNGGAALMYWEEEDVIFAGTTNTNLSNFGGFVKKLVGSEEGVRLVRECLDLEVGE